MRLLLQPGTRDNAYAGLLLTRQAFVTAELVHVVACICFDNRAHDMVPALAPIGKAFFSFTAQVRHALVLQPGTCHSVRTGLL